MDEYLNNANNELLNIWGLLDENERNRIRSMKAGMFNNCSLWGYKSRELKSGVCKYFRREMFNKFEWCVMEMMIFGLINGGLMTNIINRIKILIMEELAVNELDIINKCVYLLGIIDNERKFICKLEAMKEICDLIKHGKRCRMVSYIKNWYIYNGCKIDLSIEIKNVLRFKKNNDSDELLKLGEWLILYIRNRNENVISVFNKMLDISNQGIRYKKKDGIYLYFEILEDMCFEGKNKKLFDFVLKQFNKKNMKERIMFGVWLGLLCISNNNLSDCIDYNFNFKMNDKEMVEYLFKSREKMEINEDFVINDYHVNRNFGKDKFAHVGAFVVNEDLSLLGDNGVKYKEFYILKKEELQKINDEKKEKKKSVGNVEKKKLPSIESYEFIDFDEFKVEKVLVDGVCGMKTCCIIVSKNNNMYVLKEMKKSFNYGKDYMFIDDIKKEFNIVDLKMKLIRSNKGLEVIDKMKRTWKNNYKFLERNLVYSMMKFYENIGDLINNKNILLNEEKIFSMLKIRLFDGLFRCSDNNLRNILVLLDGSLLSIDENDIFGKRVNIFKKNDWCLKNDWVKKNINNVIDDLWGVDKDEKKIKIINYLIEYGFENKIAEFEYRWENYKDIVNNEFN